MATRRERVVLSLEDDFTGGMAKAAAATALLNRELSNLSGRSVQADRSTQAFTRDLSRVKSESRGADRSINQLTGRLRLFADAAAIFGPAAVPVGGVLAAGVAGFASQLGFAAIAGGVLVGSMQGLGDALKTLNTAHLEPTAENLAKAEDALNSLSPAAANFAREAYDMLPALKAIRDMGAEGLFPGLTESLDDLERLAPVVGGIFARVGEALGEIAADGAASLASERWADFFDFIATEAPTALSQMASALGSVTHGLAEMWMAFEPLNGDFNGWLADAAAGFDKWATGLSKTQGFREFVDYIQSTGPQVAETFGALANAVMQIVQAAAPLGGPVLRAIEGFANALAAIADTGAGAALIAAAAGFAAISRAMVIFDAAKGSKMVAMMSDLSKNGEQAGRGARALGAGLGALLAIQTLDSVQTQFEGISTGLNGLTRDLMGGNLPGEFDNLTDSLTRLSDPNLAQGLQDNIYNALPFLGSDSRVDEATAQFEALDAALVNIATTQGASQATAAFEQMADSMGLTAGQTKNLLALLPGYTDAIVDVSNTSSQAANNHALYDSLQAETRALENNIAAMQAKRDANLAGFSAETSYAAALMDSSKSVKENGRAWNLNTEAGINNRRALEGQAGAWNQLNRNTEQTPGAFRKARTALMETAEEMGASKKQARQYADQLLDIPNDLKTKIGLDVDTAMQRVQAIKSELASIDRNIDVYVNVRRPNAGGFGPQVGTSADGGTVPRTGKPYADRHLYLLADGEEVISNRHGQADRHRSLLKAINGGLANGGTTGRDQKKRKPPSLDFDHVIDGGPRPADILDMLRAAEAQENAAAQQADAARTAARAAEDQVDAAEKGAKTAEDNLDAAKRQYDDFRESVRGQYSGSLTGGGLAGLTRTLQRDTNASNSQNASMQALVGAGLDVTGPAAGLFRELSASNDQQTINELLAAAQGDPAYLTMLEEQYAARDAANDQRANAAAQATYGPIVAQQEAALAVANAQLAQAQYDSGRSEHRAEQLAGQLTQMQQQVGDLAGQLAEALNGVASSSARSAPRSSAQAGRWR